MLTLHIHRVVITDPENSNKMADANQPQNYSASIERRNTDKSFSWYVHCTNNLDLLSKSE